MIMVIIIITIGYHSDDFSDYDNSYDDGDSENDDDDDYYNYQTNVSSNLKREMSLKNHVC